jgi:hypothetical protein
MTADIPSVYGTNRASVQVVTASPVVVPAAYHTGDVIGGLITFAYAANEPGGYGTICSAELIDKAAQAVKLELALFMTTLPGTTLTDNAAFTPADADLLAKICSIKFETYDYDSYANNATASKGQLVYAYSLPTGVTSIYGVLVSRGAPTYASASDIQIALGFLRG